IRERMYMSPAGFLASRGRYSEAFRKKDEANIGNLYRANGFHGVKITSTEERSNGSVTVTVSIDEGAQWLVERVAREGIADESRRQTLEGLLASAPGQPFSEANMAADRATILNWYFAHGYARADLRAAWKPATAPHRASITYSVTEGELHFIRDVITTGLR